MLRIIDIIRVLAKYRVDEYLFRNTNTRFLFRAVTGARNFFGVKKIEGSVGSRLRMALQELGPVFVKFGQIAATRPDIVPDHLVRELSNLKDNVKPFEYEQVKKIIEEQFEKPLEHLFQHFEHECIAAGSMAQVHFAQMTTGEYVAVKVLRPNIRNIIESDIELFKQIVSLISIYRPDFRQFQIHAVIDKLANSIMQELDLIKEADNIIRFENEMHDCKFVHVPHVYHATENVLIMQRMYGTPIDQIQNQNIDVKKVVTQGLEALLLQVFRNGFFHADQHSGNLWIQDDGSRVYLDFGIMGELTRTDREILLKILYLLYTKKYIKVTEEIVKVGWIHEISNQQAFEEDLALISNLFVGKRQKDFSLGGALNQLMRTFKSYQVQVPTQYTLLVKTIIQIEGTSKLLAPELNLEKIVVPILTKHFAKKA